MLEDQLCWLQYQLKRVVLIVVNRVVNRLPYCLNLYFSNASFYQLGSFKTDIFFNPKCRQKTKVIHNSVNVHFSQEISSIK